jgi:hypothetical protein
LNHGEIWTVDLASVVSELRPVVKAMVTLMKIREGASGARLHFGVSRIRKTKVAHS